MIRDLELRLAEVLGERLPAPFGGHVEAAPVTGAPGGSPRVVLGVTAAERVDRHLGGEGPQIVPGAPDPRRVLRLLCTVTARVEPATGEGRAQRLAGLDALGYAFDDPALLKDLDPAPGTDPGFQLDRLDLTGLSCPLSDEDEGEAAVTASALGAFWPAGTAGESGPVIVEIAVRAGLAPITLTMPPDPFTAGGPAGQLTLRLGAAGTMRLTGDGPEPRPFGRLALRLAGPGGTPGAGTLGGGTAGADPGTRLVDLADGAATVQYTPPAAPARDLLVVALDDSAGGPSVELDRVPLEVR